MPAAEENSVVSGTLVPKREAELLGKATDGEGCNVASCEISWDTFVVVVVVDDKNGDDEGSKVLFYYILVHFFHRNRK